MHRHRIWKDRYGKWRLDIGGGSYVQFESCCFEEALSMSDLIRHRQALWAEPPAA